MRPARRRYVFEATEPGMAAHLSWLRAPVRPETVARDLGLHLMRFVLMEHLLDRQEVLGFLRGLAEPLAAFTDELERHAAAVGPGTGHPRLALEHGVAVHRASLDWTERTIAALRAASALAS
jgi:hypothetical protein